MEEKKALDKIASQMKSEGQLFGQLESYKLKGHDILVQRIENSVKNLEESIKQSSASADKLSKKLLWLNVILTVATVIAALMAIFGYFLPTK